MGPRPVSCYFYLEVLRAHREVAQGSPLWPHLSFFFLNTWVCRPLSPNTSSYPTSFKPFTAPGKELHLTELWGAGGCPSRRQGGHAPRWAPHTCCISLRKSPLTAPFARLCVCPPPPPIGHLSQRLRWTIRKGKNNSSSQRFAIVQRKH